MLVSPDGGEASGDELLPDRAVPVAGRRALAGRATAALVSQFVVAGSSLVLQVVAARRLGSTGLAEYSLLVSILITVNALQSGWLGDSLTVLPRTDRDVRGALFGSQAVIALGSAVIGFGSVLLLDVGGVRAAALFAAALVLWVIEETFRRLLMARLEFWQLVANDVAYAIGALASLGVLAAVSGQITLETLLLSTAIGSFVAIAVACVQLPRDELRPNGARWTRTGHHAVAAFGLWRSLQSALRPLALLVLRLEVVFFASREVLGRLEVGRLVMAPAITAVVGAGSFLLPTFSQQTRERAARTVKVSTAMVALVGAVACYTAVTFAFRTQITDVLTDGSVSISSSVLIAWGIFTAGFAAGMAPGNAAVARRQSREVFAIRTFDFVTGAVLSAVLLAAGLESWAPAGAGAGMFLGAALLWRLHTTTRTNDPEGAS
jgi:hypothetical protein